MKTILKAAGLYSGAVFLAGFVLGTLRVLLLAPQVGARAAELIEMPFMLAVMIVAARWSVRRVQLAPRARVRLAMGFIALALVLVAELTLGTPGRDPVSGSVYYVMLGLFALMPELAQSGRWYSSHRAALGAAALAAIVLGFGYTGYVADLESAYRRVASGREVVPTPCGPIEYAAAGQGPAVLLVHGAGGGFDQGMEFGGELARRGFRVVAMSRFGYLGTPLPPRAFPEDQADAHACLLDALGIERAAIIGVSAGAPSTMQFALRHPKRAAAMVLLVPLAYAPPPATPPASPSPAARFMYERAVHSDFLYWLAMRLAPGTVQRTILATPPAVVEAASTKERARVERVMEHILPLSRRQAGLLNDERIARFLPAYDVERISAPTLVISLADDLYGTFESAGYTAAGIRGSRFIGYVRGGHVWAGHHDAILDEVSRFLRPGMEASP